ncbi:MAG: hypothetical protein A3F93_04470 [Candidatus Magasanikbacteria bacterium RIFCSPLOWO2_12_FULL_34_7]|nr:MAG: hypothetical protein A3F93_04470 [Candidatus Magasanikbacteria bacterium RIFCSPLOWO2_12_FULL_34_7]
MKRKILSYIFWVMFLVPEILWSPLWNSIDSLLQNSNNAVIFRPNFLTGSGNINILLLVLAAQFVGLLGMFVTSYKARLNRLLKTAYITVLVLLIISTGFVLFVGFSLRHGIGF